MSTDVIKVAQALFRGLMRWLCFGFLMGTTGGAWSLAPPASGEVEQLRASGQITERIKAAKALGNHLLEPQSINMLRYRRGQADGSIAANAPPPAWSGGLPSTGSPRVLVLLVDFSDYPRDALNTQALINERMFGVGGTGVAGYPQESLRAYYQRASYGALNIQGFVAPWYRAKYPRTHYESLGIGPGNIALIDEALTALKSTGHAFTQYDNNADGDFDTLFVKWTGPAGPWASFWWAYKWDYSGSIMLSNKRPNKIIWSWVSNAKYTGDAAYTPGVDIHETGHALGLPDYYDYDPAVGLSGGVGGLDMMDGNRGDHGAFSKFVLGWLTPTVVSAGSLMKGFYPSGTKADAVLVMPGANVNTLFGEYFLAQYRHRAAGNDADQLADGIMLWHIDATLNAAGTDYLYNNSSTAHKLLQLVQADGLGQIEVTGQGDAGDFYTATRTFGPTTNPNSNRYNGTPTGVSMTGLGVAGATMPATFSLISSGFELKLNKVGTGAGTVTSIPAGIACGANCTARFSTNAPVTLTAVPASGSIFSGWSGACSGTGPTCIVSMTTAKAVIATFSLPSYALVVSKTGTGVGTVNSSPAGINCGTTCSATLVSGASITLTATPASGSTFAGWSGACAGSGACMVSVLSAKSVTATFNVASQGQLLTVNRAGPGAGTVSSVPAGINCGTTCSTRFTAGSSVTLNAVAAAGSVFTGWSGACTGTGTCAVSLSTARTVTATFAVKALTLGDALDNTALAWTTVGNALWQPQTSVNSDGVDAGKAGKIGNSQSSTIQTTVQGPGILRYRWKVSSQVGGDLLTFLYDGAVQTGAVSGESGWVEQAWIIPVGTHVLRWRYAKNASLTAGLDSAWLDAVRYTPSTPAPMPVTAEPGGSSSPTTLVPLTIDPVGQ